jgi:hypothetical protein
MFRGGIGSCQGRSQPLDTPILVKLTAHLSANAQSSAVAAEAKDVRRGEVGCESELELRLRSVCEGLVPSDLEALPKICAFFPLSPLSFSFSLSPPPPPSPPLSTPPRPEEQRKKKKKKKGMSAGVG